VKQCVLDPSFSLLASHLLLAAMTAIERSQGRAVGVCNRCWSIGVRTFPYEFGSLQNR